MMFDVVLLWYMWVNLDIGIILLRVMVKAIAFDRS